MSQSDYIKLKRTTSILKSNQNQTTKLLPSVLDTRDYNDFKSYNLEITNSNTKNRYSRLVLNTNKIIFNMEKNITNCSTFQRINRVINSGVLGGVNGIYVNPVNNSLPNFKPNINKTFIPKVCK